MKTIEELHAEFELNFNRLKATISAGFDPSNLLREQADIAYHINAHSQREKAVAEFTTARQPLGDEVASYAYSLYSDAMALDKALCAYSASDDTAGSYVLTEAEMLINRMDTLKDGIINGLARVAVKLKADIEGKHS
jgi:hypothetical protein